MNEKHAQKNTDWNETFVEDTLNEPRHSHTTTYAYKTRSNEALFKFGQTEQSLRSLDEDILIGNLVCDSVDMRAVPLFLDSNKFSNPFFRFKVPTPLLKASSLLNSQNKTDDSQKTLGIKVISDRPGHAPQLTPTPRPTQEVPNVPPQPADSPKKEIPPPPPPETKPDPPPMPKKEEEQTQKEVKPEAPMPVPKESKKVKIGRDSYYIGKLKMAVDDDPKLPENWNRQFKMHILQNHMNLLELKEAQNSEKPMAVPVKPVLPQDLDIDETLVHVIKGNEKIKPKHNLKLARFGYPTIDIRFNLRPHVKEFLEDLKQHCHLALMTASQRVYAELIYGFLDPAKNIFKALFSKENCVNYTKGRSVKDLSSFDYPIEKIVLVDNFISAFALQPENGIPILPFYEDEGDKEMLLLGKFVKEKLIGNTDIRKTIANTFHTMLFHKFEDTRSLVVALQEEYVLTEGD